MKLFVAFLLLVLTACSSPGAGNGCCKICTTGKPCGDTCIAKNKNCTIVGGCACAASNNFFDPRVLRPMLACAVVLPGVPQ